MRISNLKIGAQIIIVLAIMLFVVVVMGVVSYKHTQTMHTQASILYGNSLQVRRTIAEIEKNVLVMRMATRDLMLAVNESEKNLALREIEAASVRAVRNYELLYKYYSGPGKDVDLAYDAFVHWNTERKENLRLAEAGEVQRVKESVRSEGDIGILRGLMLDRIEHISEFSRKRSDQLYLDFQDARKDLNNQLILINISMVVLAFFVGFILLREVRKPIKKLSAVINDFRKGYTNVRSDIQSKNELGILSEAFNNMMDEINQVEELNKKTALIADAMLVQDNSHRFFRELFPVLMENTNSQIAAAFLLNAGKTHFEHYESIGLKSESQNQTFSVGHLEGVFGTVISTKKINYVKSVPIDSRFIFHTVSGGIVPREMVTIPIIIADEVVAIITLGSVRKYSPEAIRLIENIFNVLTARVDGILAYRSLRKSWSQLDIQKNELLIQSSELTRQNSELERQKNQLKEVSRLKTIFLSNMSHELRTPLNSVIALSGVLNRRLSGKIPEDEYSYIEVIERNGKHLLRLINDILDISRIEAGREEIELSNFDPCLVISEVIEMIKPQAVEKNVELKQVVVDENIVLKSDVNKLKQILQNLVGNAVKFTEKGSVVVKLKNIKDNLHIEVIDTGIGIAPEHLEHIFDEFRQADGGTSRRFGGSGLGLAIARKYARLLGGEIIVSSEEEKGSVFTLILPLDLAAGNNEHINTTNVSINSLSDEKMAFFNPEGSTIMLIDDSLPAIIQVQDFLEEVGYKILVANNGEEALKLIPGSLPDGIILDLMMPGIDGFQVLEKLRNSGVTGNIPVLILSAKHITKEELTFLKKNNIHQLIQKGNVNKTELLSAVNQMVMKHTATIAEKINDTTIKAIPPEINGTPRVLIVEDNQDNMTTVKALIDSRYVVFEAYDGKEGVVRAKELIPDFILMDIALPGMDGIESFKAIRNDPRLNKIPVIALTASALTSDRETILAHGFDGYIVKPIDEKVFFETINQVLYGKK